MKNYYPQVLRNSDTGVIHTLPDEITSKFYLAGGTALALQIGHRHSYDLDFFTTDTFRTDLLKSQLLKMGKFQLFQEEKGTLEGQIEETRITFLHYPYPLLESTVPYENIQLASIHDILAMKLSAVSGRGSKKDFIDLFCLKEMINWEQLIEAFKKKYQGSGYNMYHIIKSLAYFDDATDEPMPQMIVNCEWNDVATYFQDIQKDLLHTLQI